MATLNDIETRLAQQFDVEHLSVYADYLQSIGDPRGELIALDLQRLEPSPRYDRVMRDWLGRFDYLQRDRMHFRYGFVAQLRLFDHLQPEDTLRRLFASPAAPFVLRVHLEGTPALLPRVLALLVEQAHPWLQRLEIRDREFGPNAARPPLFDDALCRALAEATPSLDALEVRGPAMFGVLGHPNLRAMRIHDSTGVASLLQPAHASAVFPSLRYLDLALGARYREAPWQFAALSPARLPKLTRLDLKVDARTAVVEPQALLAASEIRRQLTHVRVSRWAVAQPDELARLVDDMPQLVQLTVDELHAPRGYRLPPRVVAHRTIGPHVYNPDADPSLVLDLREFMR